MDRMLNEYTQGDTLDYEVYLAALEEAGSEDNLARIVQERTGAPFYVAFVGWDECEDECRGWDGQSRRCECGNRRVEWDDDILSAVAY